MRDKANWRSRARLQWLVTLFLAYSFATAGALYGDESENSLSLNEKASMILETLTQKEAEWTQDAQAVESHSPIRSLNVYVGEPRGGFGDVAANVIMAKKLRIERPDVTIRMVFTEKSAPLMKILLPGFDPSKDVQKIQNFEIYPEKSAHIPPADALVGFAHTWKSYPRFKKENAPVELYYREATDERWPRKSPREDSEVDKFFWKPESKSKLQSDVPYALPEDPSVGSLSTGVNHGGMYISSHKPPPVISDGDWNSWLRQTLSPEAYKHNYADAHAKPELAFSYTKLPEASELYLKALSISARREPLNQRKIVVFVKDFPKMKIPALPSNIEVVRLKSLSLDMSEALIEKATLPVMVTGDGSISMAMDHEIPFFYEANAWKEANAEALVDEILKNSKLTRQNPGWTRALHETLKISSTSPELDARRLAEIMLDHKYQSEFRSVLGKMRLKESLPHRVFDEIDVIAKQGDVAKALLPIIRDGISANTLEEHLRETILDSHTSTARRLETFETLISLKNWYSDANRDFYRKLFTSKDPFLRQPLRTYLGQNLRHEKILSILIDALSSPDSNLKKSAEAIVRPVAFNPILGEDPMTHFRMDAIRMLSVSSLKERQRRLSDCYLNNLRVFLRK